MKIASTFVPIIFVAVAGCASTEKVPVDYVGRIFTQVPQEQVAACIGQAAAVAPSQASNGLVVNASNSQPPRAYEVTHDKVQTVVTITGPMVGEGSATDKAAVHCSLPPAAAAR